MIIEDFTPAISQRRAPASIDCWFTLPRLLILLAVFIIAAFPKVIIGTESLFYRDMGVFSYPLAHFHREAFWRGEIPLWNPLSNCGIPFLAQWNSMVLYPGSFIYLLLPLPWSINLFVFAHVLLAAAGMYLLAWRWSGNRFAASVAGLLFAWNGFTLHALMWPAIIAALAWMPIVLLCIERAGERGGVRLVVNGAVVASMQILTGAAEVILLTWLVALAFAVREFIAGSNAASLTRRTRPLVSLLFCGVLAAAICAAQLLPFLDLLRNSQRDSAFAGNAWAMPLWGWANFFVPLFGCTPSLTGVYSQDAQQWTSSYYMGTATLALSVLGWRAGSSRVRWLMAIALAGLLFAWGEHTIVYTLIKKVIPALGLIRFPIKYVMLVVFALPLLAAFGVDLGARASPRNSATTWFFVAAVAVVLITIAAVVGWACVRPIPGAAPSASMQNGLWRAGFLLASAIIFWRWKTGQRAIASRVIVLCLLAADIFTHMPKQNPTTPVAAYGELPVDMSAAPKPGDARAMLSPPMKQLMRGAVTRDPLTYCVGLRRSLLEDCNLLVNIPKVDGFFPLYPRWNDELLRHLYQSSNYVRLPLLDFLGVSQLSDADEMFRWRARPTAMPMVTAGQIPIFVKASEALPGILSEQFDPRHTALLPIEAKAQCAVGSNGCRVVAARALAQRIRADVEASLPSLVVVAQTDYPGWRASIDGAETRIWRANHSFQAVVVPPGLHRLELRYDDRAFLAGSFISIAGLTFCVAAHVFCYWQARRKRAHVGAKLASHDC